MKTGKSITSILIIAILMILASCNDKIPYRSTISPEQAATAGGSSGGKKDDEEPVRPTNALTFKGDFCGCKNKKPVTLGNCVQFCAGKSITDVNEETFYATFNANADIALNPVLGSVHGWCNNQIEGDTANPNCVLEAKDSDNNRYNLPVITQANSNTVKAVLNTLPVDKTFVITLVEVISGARSNSVQILKPSEDMIGSLGPLKVAPISQYTCLFRPSSDDGNGDIYYDNAFRVHFYYLPAIPPAPIQPNSDVVCHDWLNPLYGIIDDPLYPRLELIPGIYNLWDIMDYRFYDNNGNQNEDVNDLIIQKAKNLGMNSISPTTKFFVKFPTLTTVETNQGGGNTTNAQSMGWYMAPWINTSNQKSYCLTSDQYDSDNILHQAMKDIIGVDTEGIYVGVKAPETIMDRDGRPVTGPGDFLLIRETDLKQVWFYLKNGVPTVPTDANVASVAVYFYYPLNKDSPYVKSSTQRIYQVKGANELNNSAQPVSGGGSSSSGATTNYPPHDRKIGCIPKF